MMLLPLASGQADQTNLAVVADTFIGSGALELNNGGANGFLTVGVDLQGNRHRALYRFDLSVLPSGAVVTSAVFSTTTKSASKGPFPATFALHAVLAEWREGTGSGLGKGSPAQNGEVMWTSRMLGTAAWTNAGGDFAASALATAEIASFEQTYSWDGASLVAVVQSWIDNPASNNGLLLKDQAESTSSVFLLGSREGDSPAILAIGYTVPLPPAPPTFLSYSFPANGQPRLSWRSTPGKIYDVEYVTALSGTPAWQVAESNITATASGTNTWTDVLFSSPGPPQMFYRLRERP